MMAISKPASEGWQEYPVECWGLGNLSRGEYNSYMNIVFFKFPVLSDVFKLENNSGYSVALSTYDSNMQFLGDSTITQGGEFTLPSNVAYFSVWSWDKPPLSIIDNGLLKIYYWGRPYRKPSQKMIMTGSDYLWCMGNISTGTTVDEAYANTCVRKPQPILTRNMEIDLSQCQYNISMILLTSDLVKINKITYSAGNIYHNVLSSYPTAQYYTLVLWDKPSIMYARTAPFKIIFTEL